MASRVSCFRETARQGRPRLVRAFLYLSIYLSSRTSGIERSPANEMLRSLGLLVAAVCHLCGERLEELN